MLATDQEIKLNLGSRDRSMSGWTNVDCDPHEGVDVVGRIEDLKSWADGSVSEIYASHCLEHLPHPQTLPCLKEWARVLRPGGVLYVAVPDFARVVEIYHKTGMQNWIVNYLFGDQGYPTAFHYAGFDFKRLEGLLRQAGFVEVSRVERFPVGPDLDCSTKVSTFDGKCVSLNMVAIR